LKHFLSLGTDAQEDPADSFVYRNADAMARGAALLRRILSGTFDKRDN